jgi:hypothetical protein
MKTIITTYTNIDQIWKKQKQIEMKKVLKISWILM